MASGRPFMYMSVFFFNLLVPNWSACELGHFHVQVLLTNDIDFRKYTFVCMYIIKRHLKLLIYYSNEKLINNKLIIN